MRGGVSGPAGAARYPLRNLLVSWRYVLVQLQVASSEDTHLLALQLINLQHNGPPFP